MVCAQMCQFSITPNFFSNFLVVVCDNSVTSLSVSCAKQGYMFNWQPSNVWRDRQLLPGKKYTGASNVCMCGTNNSYRHPYQPSPIFNGVKKCEILRRFSTLLAFRGIRSLWLKKGQKLKNVKQQRIAPMSGLSSITDRMQLGPQLWDLFAQMECISSQNPCIWNSSAMCRHILSKRHMSALCGY